MIENGQTRLDACTKAGQPAQARRSPMNWSSIIRHMPSAGMAMAILGAAGIAGMLASGKPGTPGIHDRAISDAWHRAVDADPGLVHVFDRNRGGPSNMHPTSLHAVVSAEAAKPLVVGERVTLVTPDGAIHTLRVCDPASATATVVADCLNAFVARAVPSVVTPVPQRSL